MRLTTAVPLLEGDQPQAGVHRSRAAVDELCQVFDGWRTAVIEGGTDLPEVLTALGQALDFPEWYGTNLDAAWDCLSDLEEPAVVIWTQWQGFAEDKPEDWTRLMALFQDRAQNGSEFAVVLA